MVVVETKNNLIWTTDVVNNVRRKNEKLLEIQKIVINESSQGSESSKDQKWSLRQGTTCSKDQKWSLRQGTT